MKRLLFFLIMLHLALATLSTFAMGERTDLTRRRPAKLLMEVREIDLGEVQSDQPVKSVKFCFTNIGEQDLLITSTSTGCACTTVQHPKKPVQPGKKGEIRVTYDGTAQPAGNFKKTIMVYSNDARNYTRIFIKGVRVR